MWCIVSFYSSSTVYVGSTLNIIINCSAHVHFNNGATVWLFAVFLNRVWTTVSCNTRAKEDSEGSTADTELAEQAGRQQAGRLLQGIAGNGNMSPHF